VLRTNPSKQWERFGREDPYYGVMSREEMRGDQEPEARELFFASGEELVESVLSLVRDFDPGFEARRVLDYGCGVGRLVIPFARQAQSVVGIDVSPSMLEEAARNASGAGCGNVELLRVDEMGRLGSDFDLVHSALVLQHIPAGEGQRVVARLAGLVRPGGIGALHFQIGARRGLRAYNALMRVAFVHNLVNVLRRRPWAYPHMEMHVYDLGRICVLLRDEGIRELSVHLAERQGGYDACTLVFRR
jgi:2-polyprenyl-3-methyl-5-hydroxy-6-metoxy-1,4-benzoquinol methylase